MGTGPHRWIGLLPDGVTWSLIPPGDFASLQARGDVATRILYGSEEFVANVVQDFRALCASYRTDYELRALVVELLTA